MATISMRCKDCGGILEVDETQNVMFCPYCGSKELILESDEVKKERIRTNAETTIEIERMGFEVKKEQEDRKTFLYWILGFIGLVLAYVVLNKLIWL